MESSNKNILEGSADDMPMSGASIVSSKVSNTQFSRLMFSELDSTQRWAARHIDELVYIHLKENDVVSVIAEKQSAGVGTREGLTGIERPWTSSSGNIHITHLFAWPAHLRHLLLHMPQIAGYAVLQALKSLGVTYINIKWVNDVLVENKKIAGSLCESLNKTVGDAYSEAQARFGGPPKSLENADCLLVLLGIGVNIDSHPEIVSGSCYEGATNLLEVVEKQKIKLSEGQTKPLVQSVIDRIDEHLFAFIMLLKTEGFKPFCEGIDRHLAYINKEVIVDMDCGSGNEKYSGIVEGIDEEGALKLRLANGSHKCFKSGRLHKFA